jgi:hypothetical protein
LFRRPLFIAHLVAGARYRKLEGRLKPQGMPLAGVGDDWWWYRPRARRAGGREAGDMMQTGSLYGWGAS